ncbi:glycoside hydrolase family protein [Nautilia sp. PV-1]|uniref:glycoside hydrolase family protein n=1 Tax=Nautilia sp. PV-1 TaxID=2579250 RepID=UPI00143B1ED3|nr:glycoside hydrolase family protein [Nautilia sp. PV-1]
MVTELIKKHEGFEGMPYNDSLGFPTIGYGTKLPITEEEAEILLEYRLKRMIRELIQKESFFEKLPEDAQKVIADMTYQLGVGGVLKFKKMWTALKKGDYKKAADEMLDSRWAKQTPNRAKELAEIMRSL